MVKMFNRSSVVLPTICLLATASFALATDKIRVYTVPKEHPPVAAANTAVADGDVHSTPVHWTTPDGWKELAPTSVRIGNFLVPGSGEKKAEVAITSFPGSVGTELDNVNRWRREIGLEPATEKDVASEKTAVGSAEGKLYDFSGAASRTVVAVLMRDGASWFFKLRGDKEVVADARKTFLEFLKSIHFAADHSDGPPSATSENAPANPHADSAQLPPNHPEISPAAANANEPSGGEGEPKWTVPSNWKEKPPGMMVMKSFDVKNGAGAATVAISSFPGEVGGKLANVNRWRGQMGLPKIEEGDFAKETQSLDVLGGKATLVDLKGTDAKSGKAARLVAVMVPHGDSTWFYKLLGDDSAVAAEKENFVKFVQTVSY